MALLTSPASNAPGPLHERTNSHTSSLSASLYAQQHTLRKDVRRIDSSHQIRTKPDSESSPEDDSIYNAEPVSSGESTPNMNRSDLELPPALISPPGMTSSTKQAADGVGSCLSPPLSPKSPNQGHSNWPTPILDTILERRSTQHLRGSASAPRLRSSPQRSPKVVRMRSSVRSVKPLCSNAKSPWPREKRLPPVSLHHQRSFSLNDLHCIKTTCELASEICSSGSSRSSEALREISSWPTFPVRPRHSPPYRSPTPPGLPSFRTREAQELRLVEQSESRRSRIFRHWFRHEEHESDEGQSTAISASERLISPPAEDQQSNQPLDLLKRVFGIPRVVNAPNRSLDTHPRASLPRGVTSASSPGVLALANDGTQVRGRFGNRASSHGIGNRTLQSHPLARSGGRSTIEEAIRDIDKACAEANAGANRNHLTQLPQFPSIAQELDRHVALSDLDRILGDAVDRRPFSGGAGFTVQSPPIPPANTCANSPLGSPIQSPSLIARRAGPAPGVDVEPPRSASSSTRYRLREPGAYPLTSPGSRSRAERASQDRIEGMQSFIDESERLESRRIGQEQAEKSDCSCLSCQEVCVRIFANTAHGTRESDVPRSSPIVTGRNGMQEPRYYPPSLTHASAPNPYPTLDGTGDQPGDTGNSDREMQPTELRRGPAMQEERREDEVNCCTRCWHSFCGCCYDSDAYEEKPDTSSAALQSMMAPLPVLAGGAAVVFMGVPSGCG